MTAKESLPSWERGLKCLIENPYISPHDVAPLVGAWIEIGLTQKEVSVLLESLPSWERGLK